jgi:hypothetical protein
VGDFLLLLPKPVGASLGHARNWQERTLQGLGGIYRRTPLGLGPGLILRLRQWAWWWISTSWDTDLQSSSCLSFEKETQVSPEPMRLKVREQEETSHTPRLNVKGKGLCGLRQKASGTSWPPSRAWHQCSQKHTQDTKKPEFSPQPPPAEVASPWSPVVPTLNQCAGFLKSLCIKRISVNWITSANQNNFREVSSPSQAHWKLAGLPTLPFKWVPPTPTSSLSSS